MDLAYIKKKRKEFLIAVYELAEGQAYKAVDVTVLAERLGIDYRNEATKTARYWLDKKILDGGPFDAVFLTTDGVAQAEMIVDETEVQATTKKCPRCWADNRVDAGFCDKCGAKFHNFEAITIDDVTIKNVTIQNVQGLASTLVNTVAPPDSLIGRVLNSKYEIKEKLGQGGFGAVYRARRMKLRDEVAVKFYSISTYQIHTSGPASNVRRLPQQTLVIKPSSKFTISSLEMLLRIYQLSLLWNW
jgi:ribosomal protein L40E